MRVTSAHLPLLSASGYFCHFPLRVFSSFTLTACCFINKLASLTVRDFLPVHQQHFKHTLYLTHQARRRWKRTPVLLIKWTVLLVLVQGLARPYVCRLLIIKHAGPVRPPMSAYINDLLLTCESTRQNRSSCSLERTATPGSGSAILSFWLCCERVKPFKTSGFLHAGKHRALPSFHVCASTQDRGTDGGRSDDLIKSPVYCKMHFCLRAVQASIGKQRNYVQPVFTSPKRQPTHL